MTEDQLEHDALGWLADVGYTLLHSPALAPPRRRSQMLPCLKSTESSPP